MASNETRLNVQTMVEGVSQVLDNLTLTPNSKANLTGSSATWGLAACILALVSFLVTLVLGLWRFWAFTIRPRLHPDEPKELPSWFPCESLRYLLSHSKQFANSPFQTTVCRMMQMTTEAHPASDYLSDTDEPYNHPFAITLSGRKCYVLTSRRDAEAAFRNTTTLSWDCHLRDRMIKFGVSTSGMSNIWNDPGPEDPRYANPSNPQHKSLVHYSKDVYTSQLLPGEKLDRITDKTCKALEHSLWRNDLPRRHVDWKSGKTVRLMDFCADVALTTMTRSFFGHLIYDIEPDFSQNLYDFNEQAWKTLTTPYPRFAARKLHRAKHGILETLSRFLQSPMEMRDDESWLVKTVQEEQKAAGLDDRNQAALAFMFLATFNLNVYRLSFWLLSYALFNKDLLAAIKAETASAFQTPDKVDHHHIYTNCPRFSAIYTETLRLTLGSISVRTVTAPTQLSGKTLKPGNTVMIPLRFLHYNEDIFGDNAEDFDATRFLNNDLENSPDFRPCADDAMHSASRFLTKRMIMVLVATVLQRSELEVMPDPLGEGKVPQIPEIDSATPTLGIMGPVKGTEVFVKIREKGSSEDEKKAE
ncbi:MAG: hypothetical protein Q9217_006617 [Psora testacea]